MTLSEGQKKKKKKMKKKKLKPQDFIN